MTTRPVVHQRERADGQHAVVILPGDLGRETRPLLEACLRDLLDAEWMDLVLDFSAVREVPPSVVAILVPLRAQIVARRCRLVVVDPYRVLERPIRTNPWLRGLPAKATVAAAEAALPGLRAAALREDAGVLRADSDPFPGSAPRCGDVSSRSSGRLVAQREAREFVRG